MRLPVGRAAIGMDDVLIIGIKINVKKHKPKQIIGRKEVVDFPELGLYGISAKIDTGAYTSTLHCRDIEVREGHPKTLCFKVLGSPEQEICFKEFKQKTIKNSSGEAEQRYVIKTKIKIAGRAIKSIISLADRGTMRFPVLIGRKLLKNKFIVDVSLNY
jgi:hypothetical protein